MTNIPVTSSAGVALTGLTVGVVYHVYTQSGPWHPHGISGGGDDTYAFEVSNDGGTTWSGRICAAGDPVPGPPVLPSWCTSRFDTDSFHVALTFTATTSSIQIRVSDTTFGDNTGTLDAEITNQFCQYGSESNPSAAIFTVVTGALVDAIALLLGGGPLLLLGLDALIGAPITFPVCTGSPPPAPTFTSADFIAGSGIPTPSGLAKAAQALTNGLWHFYCRCTAAPLGSPDPLPYPPPDYSTGPVGPAPQPVPT